MSSQCIGQNWFRILPPFVVAVEDPLVYSPYPKVVFNQHDMSVVVIYFVWNPRHHSCITVSLSVNCWSFIITNFRKNSATIISPGNLMNLFHIWFQLSIHPVRFALLLFAFSVSAKALYLNAPHCFRWESISDSLNSDFRWSYLIACFSEYVDQNPTHLMMTIVVIKMTGPNLDLNWCFAHLSYYQGLDVTAQLELLRVGHQPPRVVCNVSEVVLF